MQGARVRSLVGGDSTRGKAAKPKPRSYWAHALQPLKPVHPQPAFQDEGPRQGGGHSPSGAEEPICHSEGRPGQGTDASVKTLVLGKIKDRRRRGLC